jgi:DNA-binding response OmpR family regulator
LVIDDDRDCADSTAELLRCWGCTVWVAYHGEDGISAAVTFRPDVILLDLAMPRLDGYECIRAVSAMAGPSGAVVFAVTGYGDETHRTRALFAGFDEFLVKPVDPAELERLLRLELALRRTPAAHV